MPSAALASSGTSMSIARAILVRHWNPPRRHSRAGTEGAASGDKARYSAAESSTASSAVTQDESGPGERNRTSGRYVVWLSATSAAQRSHWPYSSGSVSRVDVPEPSAYLVRASSSGPQDGTPPLAFSSATSVSLRLNAAYSVGR